MTGDIRGLVERLRKPPFGTETSERNLMAAAADRLEALTAPPTGSALDALVDELRNGVIRTGEGPEGIEMFDVDDANNGMWNAADTITALQARVSELEGALRPFAFFRPEDPIDSTQKAWEQIYRDRVQDWIDFEEIDAARAALTSIAQEDGDA